MTDKARILFVDDEKRVLNSMRGLFRRDYELFLTSEGAEAIKIATENDIDVIVADQRMPGMTGIEVLGQIKRKSPRTVRILLTGYADPSAVEGSINIGEVFRFLSKPCPPNMLRETLSLAIQAARTKPVATADTVLPAPKPAASPAAIAASPAAVSRPSADPAARPTPGPAATPRPSADPAARPTPGPAAAPRPSADPAAQPTPEPAATPRPVAAPLPASVNRISPAPEPEPLRESDETQPALPILDESVIDSTGEHSSTHWQSITNVVMSEDTVEETQENVALSASMPGFYDVGVAIFTIDSDFASTALRAVSSERNTILATTLVKVAQAVAEQNAGVLVTDFTTNNAMLQKMIGALKQHMPELVTIVVSNGRDTTDMINLINYGQVFRYVLKPVDAEQLRSDINAAAMRHLYLRNSPESVKRHQVINAPDTGESSATLNRFLGKIRSTRVQ